MEAKNRVWGAENGIFVFECPGCGYGHAVYTEKPNGNGAKWGFNGDLQRPTFTPSVFVNSSGKGDYPKCHSFVTDGRIRFLNDCTHELAGQTVDLPEVDV